MMSQNKGKEQVGGGKSQDSAKNHRSGENSGWGNFPPIPNFNMRTFIEIQGNRYDVDEVKSVEKDRRYSEAGECMKYLIVLNRVATVKNHLSGIEFEFDTLEERDETVQLIYAKLDSISHVLSV